MPVARPECDTFTRLKLELLTGLKRSHDPVAHHLSAMIFGKTALFAFGSRTMVE